MVLQEIDNETPRERLHAGHCELHGRDGSADRLRGGGSPGGHRSSEAAPAVPALKRLHRYPAGSAGKGASRPRNFSGSLASYPVLTDAMNGEAGRRRNQ